ncbi:TRAP transporter large permease [Bosea sp. (in: a-proteobacteria)]|uniref:TRAP transporter large permease n=1 Tax=Bosea sp. (in: a-proteobacteria) TaxID=1871050 RepID=UPI00261B71DC|nr:TRAP transporter large permease [Bosea sp. (in: a-proteobacteria)]MCO5089812.1 TRAP transporter large permease [Bosea sp. (in: a-proteobacteria)]
MSWQISLLVYTALLTVLMVIGVPIAAAMGFVGIVGVTLLSGTQLWPSLADVVWNTANSFTLVAIPLFVLMGEIILRSGAAKRFYRGLAVLLNRIPGGLAQSNIMACALFSAISGSSTATALTIGTVALPEMRQRGYSDKITLGTLTGGGALGNLIPPSIFLLVYATVVQQSPIDLFVATIIPGLIAVVMFMLYVFLRVLLNPSLVPARQPSYSWAEVGNAVLQVAPVTALMLAIICGMYWGIVTPTEAAGFGCLLALLLGLAYRELTRKDLWTAMVNTIAVTCVMSVIVINGQILGFAIVQAGIGHGVSEYLAGSGLSPFVFFVVIFFLYLALGAMLDGISMMLLTVPVLYPTLRAMGFDDIWFGVILVIQAELAQLSPPIGLNLFAVQSVAKNVDLATIAWASLPYALMLSLLCFILFFMPELATWLPMAMRG